MIDRDFCDFLEYELCRAFENSDKENIKGFWCDGVLLTETADSYSVKYVNDNRKVKLKAFIGKDGQTEYGMVLKFGNKALSRFTRGLDIKECIPRQFNDNWFDIDLKNNMIEIQLE